MDKQIFLEFIKITSPYIIAILGILSPLFTTRYLNKEELLKYKKQQNHSLVISTYSNMISNLYKLKRILLKIQEQAKIFNENNFLKSIDYNAYSAALAIEYDNKITELTDTLKSIIDDNYSYLKKDIIEKNDNIIDSITSPIGVFSWRMPVMEIRKNEKTLTAEKIKCIYDEGNKFFTPSIKKITDLIDILKYEIIGEK